MELMTVRNLRFIKSAFLAAIMVAISTAGVSEAASMPTIIFGTNWYPEAQHGGYFQAVALGIYKKIGLNVKIAIGGANINGEQLLAAGKYQFYMGNALDQLVATAHHLPLVTVATIFQKSPTCIYAHYSIKTPQELAKEKYKILVSSNEIDTWWPWAMRHFGYKATQRGVYTGSVAPFLVDKNVAQQGFYGSEDYLIKKAGIKFNTFVLADYGYPEYSETIQTTDAMVKDHPNIVRKFIKATLLGWKSYLQNSVPGDNLIMKYNPKQTPAQLAYGVKTMLEGHLLTGPYANKYGIGSMSSLRWRNIYDVAVKNGVVPKGMDYKSGYNLSFIRNIHVYLTK